jgi:short-subunit dehydrogenase
MASRQFVRSEVAVGTITTQLKSLTRQTAVVTGASRGIGRAIAISLAQLGAHLCLVGREPRTLQLVNHEVQDTGISVECYGVDLTVDAQILKLIDALHAHHSQIDLLIHSSGHISIGPIEQTPVDELDHQYRINVRAPYLLTQALLPALRRSRGQIVFINSSVVSNTRTNVAAFAMTQHALKALADVLREEVNGDGIRVLSVFPGRTATARQEAIHHSEGKAYFPNRLLQPEDIAEVVVNALALPRTAEVTQINLRPFVKSH